MEDKTNNNGGLYSRINMSLKTADIIISVLIGILVLVLTVAII